MRHVMQGHVAAPRGPMRAAASVEVARTCGRATRVHADARVAPTWQDRVRLADDGPMGIVGPCYSIGVVTQMCYIVSPFILANSVYFLRVGLCSLLISSLLDTW